MSATTLQLIQVILSVILIILVLIQASSAGVGGAFGGSDSMTAGYHSRRGSEKVIFIVTLIIAILFACSSVASFILG